MDKKALRKMIRDKKRAMTPEQITIASKQLEKLFLQTEEYANADTLYAYLPYNQEVRTEGIIQKALADGKSVAVPKVYGEEMRFILISDLNSLELSTMGIPEPVADEPIATDSTALILMPGLAFDRQGHRIGYGGGFYDKYLAREPDHPTVALCYDFQILQQLETDVYDIPVDKVIWANI